ncbi:MAG: RidA family protein [Nannocystis sp.]|jgi:2-iminobutanoate/2-iminopropanoate deaminase|nr:RidA family protein [Nannocystis sp.]
MTSVDNSPVFSWFRDHNGLIYTSGHAAVDVETRLMDRGELMHEARLTLENLRRTLESAGSSLSKVLKVTVYLTDISYYAAFNHLYARYFPGPSVPARTCVEVSKLPYGFKIEIEAIASV